MKKSIATLLVSHALLAEPAVAEPCVGMVYDRPFPGAVEVSIHQVDVPAAQFPGIWQDGMIEGQFYQIFANRVAVLQAERTAPAWSININCQKRPCTITVAGSPPATAMSTTKRLEQCLAPQEIKAAAAPDKQEAPAAKSPPVTDPAKAAPREPAAAKPAPSGEAAGAADSAPIRQLPPKARPAAKSGTVAAADPRKATLSGKPGDAPLKPTLPDARNAAPNGQMAAQSGNAGTETTCPSPQNEIAPVAASTCRPAVIQGSDPVATLQQLLVMAGADPGSVDGLYGSRTKEAVLEVLGYRGRNLDVSESIAALDVFLCGQ